MIRRTFRNGRGGRFRGWLLQLLLVLGAMLTAACGDLVGKTYPPYRYRLTVEIETPQGLRTGSSVIEVQTIKGARLSLSGGGIGGDVVNRVKGQAVAVDLPNGQTLFALLRSDWGPELAENIYPLQVPYPTHLEVAARSPDGKWNPDLNFDMWMERVEAARGVFVVPRVRKGLPGKQGVKPSGWPMLVRFRDIRDPASVEEVKPEELKAAIGKGYAVRRVTVERTEDPIAVDIARRLPWLAKSNGSLVEQPRNEDGSLVPLSDAGLAVNLTDQAFQRRDYER